MTDRWRAIILLGGIPALAICVLTLFVVEYRSEQNARRVLLAAVSSASGAQLNGQPVDDPSVLLRALRTLDHVPAHHSSHGTPIRIQLVCGPSVTEVVIARDSYVAHEFWVYRAGPSWNEDPLGESAGRIRSEALDAFLERRGL